MIEFQITFLQRLNFCWYPNITPSSCIDILLLSSGAKDTKEITDIAGMILTDFLTVRTSMLYAPSTIALCAITTAYTYLGQDCTSFLATIPEIYFADINSDNEVLKSYVLNFEKCLSIFDKLRQMRMVRRDAFLNETKCKQTAVVDDDEVQFNNHHLVKVNGRYIDNEDISDDKLDESDDHDESGMSTICNMAKKVKSKVWF